MDLGHIIKKKRVLFTRIVVAAVGVLILFSGSRWEMMEIYSAVLFIVGVIMVGIATVGRLWCNLYICGYKSGKLITVGPYSMCRNPLYFFSLIGAVGLGLATETFSIPLIFLVVFFAYYPFVIRAEEKKLSQAYGQEFQRYCREIPRFIPSFRTLQEPQEYLVKARLFRKSLFDATCFIWLIGILEFIEALHESDILPVFINLY